VLDARGKVVLPGAVDGHFHLGIYRDLTADTESETESALVGGVTTLLSYFRTGHDYLDRVGPYREVFPEVLARTAGHAYTDYGFHIAIMTEAQLLEVPWLVAQGVTSFKYYMFYKALNLTASSTNASAYTMTDTYDLGHLYRLMQAVAAERDRGHGRVSLGIHCEQAEIMRVFLEAVRAEGLHSLEAYSRARPDLSEELAIAEAGILARELGCPVNLLHLSSARALRAASALRREHPDLDIRLETTLHHLALTYATSFGGTAGKVNPPLRTPTDVEALWRGVQDGEIDQVVSDHAAVPEVKPQDLWEARSGFGGTALLYPVMLSEGHHRRGLGLERVAQLVSGGPARAYGLAPRKGALAVGADADLAIVDLEREQTVTPDLLHSAQPFTPFQGMRLKGWPVATVVRGRTVLKDGRLVSPPTGEYLSRPLAAPA
jgi:dihydroorotase-like cyclic amidohydrolase